MLVSRIEREPSRALASGLERGVVSIFFLSIWAGYQVVDELWMCLTVQSLALHLLHKA